ncbi:hypothetical protein D3C87_1613250 [compost metagenome]
MTKMTLFSDWRFLSKSYSKKLPRLFLAPTVEDRAIRLLIHSNLLAPYLIGNLINAFGLQLDRLTVPLL